jgi:hypothetical protein
MILGLTSVSLTYGKATGKNDMDFFQWITAILTCFVMGIVTNSIDRFFLYRQQRFRDKRALEIFSAVKAGKPAIYSLYLRGFGTTGHLHFGKGGKARLEDRLQDLEIRGGQNAFSDLETLITEAMEYFAPMIALGRPGEQLGAGRVETEEENWIEDFQLLALHAKTLVLFPIATEGTLREVEFIVKHGFWPKTIILMPTENPSANWDLQWDYMKRKAEEFGLDFPVYQSGGMVFKIGQQGSPEDFQSLSGVTTTDFKQTIFSLLVNKGTKH